MKRRTLLLGAGALSLSGSIMWARSGSVDLSDLASRPKLKLPTLLDATQSRRFSLVATAGETNFLGSKASATSGFNQAYLGPVVRLPLGNVQASVTNTLNTEISSHWHGLLIPGELDGGPHQAVAPGSIWKPELNIDQPPTTAWFHTHLHGRTATGVYSGLAGGIIVTDERDDERGLPTAYGVDDLFLIIQDKQFSANGGLVYDNSVMSQMHGFTGKTVVVNGQVGAIAEVPKGIVRLRLLNGSNARIFRMGFEDSRAMHLVATDGGLLTKPVAIEELRLSPGERAEVLVDFSDGNSTVITSLRDPNAGFGGMMGRFQRIGAKVLGGRFEVLAFVSNGETGRITKIPENLGGSLPDLTKEKISQTRRFTLDMRMDGMMSSRMAINGKSFDASRVDFQARLGSVEKWIVSSSMLAHPFHIHGVSFQVTQEDANNPSAQNIGWKDTVLVENEVELLVKFTQTASNEAPFMYHCHILEHEDAGMMGQFSVV